MSEIWIQEEKVDATFLENLGHYTKLDGDIRSVYFIGEVTEDGDYVELNKEFLKRFLIEQNHFPLYLTFIPYDDMEGEFIDWFNEIEIKYDLDVLQEKRTYYTLFKKHQYHPPCFTVELTDESSLSKVLDKTYWLAAQNEFYSISYCDNLHFKLENTKMWGRKKDVSIPHFRVDHNSTFITIFHDGAGFYLFSNEHHFSTISNLRACLPDGAVVTQINDTLLKKDE